MVKNRQVLLPSQVLACWVALGTSFPRSGPQFPHLQNEGGNDYRGGSLSSRGPEVRVCPAAPLPLPMSTMELEAGPQCIQLRGDGWGRSSSGKEQGQAGSLPARCAGLHALLQLGR